MNVLELKFKSKNSALYELEHKGVIKYDENSKMIYPEGVESVVFLGNVVLEQPVLDDKANEIKPAVISDEYFCDVLTSLDFKFNDSNIRPVEEKHKHKFNEYNN